MTREEAINTLKNLSKLPYWNADKEALDIAIKALEQEPKTGHWIRVDKDKLKCPECDVIHFIAQYPQGKIAWCPNCGTKMDKENGDANK